MSRQPYMSFVCISTRSAGAIGLACSTAMTCQACLGPTTNSKAASAIRGRLLRTTGQKGLTQRTLQRQGAWELLPRPPTEAQVLDAVCHTPPEDLAQERQRFRLQSRSRRQVQAQFDHLRQKWSALQPTGTG